MEFTLEGRTFVFPLYRRFVKGQDWAIVRVLPKENHQILYSTRQIWAGKYSRMAQSSPDGNREKTEQEERKMSARKEEQVPIRILAGCSKGRI